MKTMRQVEVSEISQISCDRCSKTVSMGGPDSHGIQSIHFTAGNGSAFGDGCEVSIDICEKCLQETLGQWLRIAPSPWLQNCIDLTT